MKAARQQAIVDLLITHSSLTTETLSKQLNVSRETIRRDLSELQAQGKVLRNHGRAKVIHQRSQDSGDPFHMRLKSHYAHKADIAREGLRLGVDFAQTVSCYQADANGLACGHCDACHLRAQGFADAGILDPTYYIAR